MTKRAKDKQSLKSGVTTFWGTGASGCTAFALEYGRQLADSGERTLLIDIDLIDPSLMVYLAVDNYPSGLQAGLRLASQQRLDPSKLHQLLIKSDDIPNLSLMAGLPAQGRYLGIDVDSIGLLIEILSEWFDQLVIDLGSLLPTGLNAHATELQAKVIESSDWTYGVFRADPEGIAKLFWLPITGQLVANNYRPGSLGPSGKKALKSIVGEITGSDIAAIAEEDEYLAQAISKALPVGYVHKKSRVSQSAISLIENRLESTG